ncbi:MAG: hypothetical protein [Bacteriophage sp.]|nr:MAG: hypothetical protein [Bacteriophage sp.]
MALKYCTLCQRNVTPRRKIGIGTFIAVIFTGFAWILFIPFYRKRCPLCDGVALVEPEKVANKNIKSENIVTNHQRTHSVADEIRKLNELKESGVLSPAEFEMQKRKLLNK